MRLDRYLADLGAGTRSSIRKSIRRDGVLIGDKLIRDPGFPVDEKTTPSVVFEGETWQYEPVVWYMLNKPAGVLSASEDRHQRTVLDLLRENAKDSAPARAAADLPEPETTGRQCAGVSHLRTDLFPVGRLDKDTEGLLLITNDGQTAHRLLSPRFHVDKTYYVRAAGTSFTQSDADRFAAGIRFDENLTALPARLEILGPHEARVTIREGKFHQIRKMIAALGGEKEVLYLRRERFGPLTLDSRLGPGQFRPLSREEQISLSEAAGLSGESH